MDPIVLQFIFRCALAAVAIVAAAVLCSRLEKHINKRLNNWNDNLKDIEL